MNILRVEGIFYLNDSFDDYHDSGSWHDELSKIFTMALKVCSKGVTIKTLTASMKKAPARPTELY